MFGISTGDSTIDTILIIGVFLFIIMIVLRMLGFDPGSRRSRNNRKYRDNDNNNGTNGRKNRNIDYRNFDIQESILTNPELYFYKTLEKCIGNRAVILAKVRLADIFKVSEEIPNSGVWVTHFNTIKSKHVDFLICDSRTYAPKFAIELDDSSHNRKRNKESDDFKNNLFNAKGLPLVRIARENRYYEEEINKRIDKYLE